MYRPATEDLKSIPPDPSFKGRAAQGAEPRIGYSTMYTSYETPPGPRPPAATKTPLFSQSSSGAAASIAVEVRNVYSLGETCSPRARRASTSDGPWRVARD